MPLDISFQIQKKISTMYCWRRTTGNSVCSCLPVAFAAHLPSIRPTSHDGPAQPNFLSGPQRRYFPSARKVKGGRKYLTDAGGRSGEEEGRPCERRRRRFGPLLFQPCWAPSFLDPVPSSRPQLPIFGSLEVWFCYGLLGSDQFGIGLSFARVWLRRRSWKILQHNRFLAYLLILYCLGLEF